MTTLSDFSVVHTLCDEQRHIFHEAESTVRELSKRIDHAHAYFESMRSQHVDCILRTPLQRARWLCTPTLTTYMKLESEQVTGSFKARGALYFAKKAKDAGAQHIVSASSGNHALGIAHALSYIDCRGTLYLPENCVQSKVRNLRNAIKETSIDLRFQGTDCVQAEIAASQSCQSTTVVDGQPVYASPYNDLNVMAGNGTVAKEILDDLIKVVPAENSENINCACYVTVGGGGLISAIATKLKTAQPGRWRIVGCLPSNSAAMFESVKAGAVVEIESEQTISDGSAGGLEPGTITLGLCGHLVDAWAIVGEREIGNAMERVFSEQRKVLEGAAGVAVAGFLRDASWHRKQHRSIAVIVTCGTNVDVDTFAQIISGRFRYDRDGDTKTK